MEWNIESSTLKLNGDEQDKEKIIQVEVPIQQRVSANKGDANSIVEVQSPATLLETGADNNANNSANMGHQWPTWLVQLIDLLKDEKNTQSDSFPISATAFIPTTTSTSTPFLLPFSAFFGTTSDCYGTTATTDPNTNI